MKFLNLKSNISIVGVLLSSFAVAQVDGNKTKFGTPNLGRNLEILGNMKKPDLKLPELDKVQIKMDGVNKRPTQLPELKQIKSGGIHGGGGSEEARTFAKIAYRQATYLFHIPQYKKFAEQILETLSLVEVRIVSDLSTVCTQASSEADASTLYARSCVGEIYLLDRHWKQDHKEYIVSGSYTWGKRWLMSEYSANEHLKDIFHEIFRAGNPNSKSYITNDPGYSITSKIFAHIKPGDWSLTSNCENLGSGCSMGFDEDILHVGYDCRVRADHRADLHVQFVGTSGQKRSMQIGGAFPKNEACQERAKFLRNSDYTQTVVGKSYFCVPQTYNAKAALYITFIRPDLSFFSTKIEDELSTTECMQMAEEKWNSAH